MMCDATNRTKWLGLSRFCVVCSCAIGLSLGSIAGAKTIEEVEKDIIAKYSKIKSYTADTEIKFEMDLGQGNKTKSQSKGTMTWKREGDKFLYRTESVDTSETIIGEEKTKTKTTSTVVSDGDFLYSLSDTDGQRAAFKMKIDPVQGRNAEATFKIWHEYYDLKLLADEKIEKNDCYVIEATPKPKKPKKADDQGEGAEAGDESEGAEAGDAEQISAVPLTNQKFWYRKDLGMMVKMVLLDKDGKPTTTSTTTNIKLDPDIKPETFKLKLPEGVQLVDMTKMQEQQFPETAPADVESEAPADEDVEDAKQEEEAPPAEEKKEKKGLKGLFKKRL